jgi:hypothetical protein
MSLVAAAGGQSRGMTTTMPEGHELDPREADVTSPSTVNPLFG